MNAKSLPWQEIAPLAHIFGLTGQECSLTCYAKIQGEHCDYNDSDTENDTDRDNDNDNDETFTGTDNDNDTDNVNVNVNDNENDYDLYNDVNATRAVIGRCP